MNARHEIPASVRNLEARADRELAWVQQQAATHRVREPAQEPVVQALEPEPLRRPMPCAESYPLDALGPILAPAARSIERVVQAPDAVIGASLLAAASLAAQAHADVHVDGRTSPLSLWHVTIAESGERKSAVDAWALRAHRDAEQADIAAHRSELIDFNAAQRAHEAAAKHAERQKDPAAIRTALADLGAPPDKPLLPYLLTREPTLQGLQRFLIEGRGYGGVFSDDGGDFLGGHAMGKEHKMATAAALSALWDNGTFDRVRAGDGVAKHYGKRVALHVMVQPVIAESLLSDPLLAGQGFLPRCLLAWPPTRAGTRAYVETDLSTDPAMLAYWRRCHDLLERKPALRPDTRNELAPRLLGLDREGKALFVRLADGIERSMAPEGPMAQVRAWASKSAEQALRIAGVLALLDDPEAQTITCAVLARAGELAGFHLGEAARMVGTASVPAEIRHAELILAWCRDRSLTRVSSRELVRNGPSAIRTADAVHAAMAVLERHGWASRIEGDKRREWVLAGGSDHAVG